jgi:hypothetical protein
MSRVAATKTSDPRGRAGECKPSNREGVGRPWSCSQSELRRGGLQWTDDTPAREMVPMSDCLEARTPTRDGRRVW